MVAAYPNQSRRGSASCCTTLLALALLLLLASATNAIPRHSLLVPLKQPWGRQPAVSPLFRITHIRGGSSSVEEDDDDVEEADTEDDEEEEDEENADTGVQIEMNVEKYDEPLVASPMLNMYASIGIMLLGRKIDLFNPTIVRLARFAFVAFLVCYQLFLLYARIQAVSHNDRTPIELKSPLSSVLQSQLGGGGNEGGSNAMMKSLASSFLASKSTVLEYDLKQIKSMQSGMIFNMLFMWVLHFKMKQVQPLIIQSITGMVNLIYSPLFQVYGLGRNLERPFKSPPGKPNPFQAPETTETVAESDSESSVEETENLEDENENEEEDTEKKEDVEEKDEDDEIEEEESVAEDE